MRHALGTTAAIESQLTERSQLTTVVFPLQGGHSTRRAQLAAKRAGGVRRPAQPPPPQHSSAVRHARAAKNVILTLGSRGAMIVNEEHAEGKLLPAPVVKARARARARAPD